MQSGRSLRATYLVFLFFFVASLASGQNPGQRSIDTAATVLRYEAWRGGLAFSRITAIHMTGSLVADGLSGTIDIWSTENGKVRQSIDLGTFKQQTIIADHHGWSTQLSGQFEVLTEAETQDAMHDADLLFDDILHGRDGAVVSLGSREMSGGKTVDVLKISFGASNAYDYELSPVDGQLLAIRSVVNGKTKTTTFGDWRIVHHVRVPFEEHVAGNNVSDSSTTRFTAVEFNPQMSDVLFAPPVLLRPKLFRAGTSSSGWLPFEFFGGTRIFIPATINGKQTVVMLDSGASSSVLDRHFAESIGLKPKGEMTAEGAGGSSTLAVVDGVTLTLGDLELTGQTMVAIDMSGLQQQLGHALPIILGNEVFQNTVVDIDFAQRRINFRDPATFEPPADATSVDAFAEDGIHAISVAVEGKPATMQFDLGNASPLLLFPRFWQQPGFMDGRRTSTTEIGGLGGMHVDTLAMVRSVSLGGSDFTNVPTTMEGSESAAARSGRLDGNIGLPVMSRFHLIVDFSHRRVLFEPPVEVSKPFNINHTGLTLKPSSTGEIVLYVAPQSPGELAGLKKDDVIVAANGISLAKSPGNSIDKEQWRYDKLNSVEELTLSDGRVLKLTLAKYF